MHALPAVILFSAGCRHPAPAPNTPTAAAPVGAAAGPFSPSPRLIVGRVLSVDRAQGIAVVDLQTDAPREALNDGTELLTRDYSSLVQTAVLHASRYVRGRTLGAKIVTGNPVPGDEVVWLAP